MGIPLEEIAGGRQRDHDARSVGRTEMKVTPLFDSLCPRLDEFEQELAAPPEERPQEAGNGQNDVAVGNGSEKLGAEPFGPEELFFLLARGAKRPTPTRERHDKTRAAGREKARAKPCSGSPQVRKFLRTRSTTGRSGP